jgi:hypothetical protein
MTDGQLIMELTMEQGPGRETQVQPPLDVWIRYFGISFARLPRLRFSRRTNTARTNREVRPVVEHDHNWTIELDGAAVPRPAIIRFSRTAPQTYDYWVYTPGQKEYEHCRWILQSFENPIRRRGRRWLII